MKVQIEYLANKPELIPTLAQWTFGEWGRFDPLSSLEASQFRLRERLSRDHLPLTFVALSDEQPVGCVSLKISEMTIRPQLSPWLGSLFVVPEYRSRNIGSSLVERAIAEAKRLKQRELYLWTPNAEEFYLRFGFQTTERVTYLDQEVRVMILKVKL